MDPAGLAAFLAIIAVGSYVQALSGFALGLIVLGAATVLDLAPIAFTATVINIVSLLNGLWVLHHHYRDVHWKILLLICVGLVPGVAIGLEVLRQLDASSPTVLKNILGCVLLGAGLVLTLKPHPHTKMAKPHWNLWVGLSGGILGGLFSTAGPPVVFYLYRQPLAVLVIRSTLLAVFTASTVSRIAFLGLNQELHSDVLQVGLAAFPVVLATAHFGARHTAHVPPLLMRRFAFGLLMVLGLFLLVRPG